MCHLLPVETPVRSTAAVAAVTDGTHFLIVRELNRPKSYWKFPGGGLEAGELPQEAASRELHEETGVIVPATAFYLADARIVPSRRSGQHFRYFLTATVAPAILEPFIGKIVFHQDPTSKDQFEVTCITGDELFTLTEQDEVFIPPQYPLARRLSLSARRSQTRSSMSCVIFLTYKSEPKAGIEPATFPLRRDCSTI